ncbi:MAG: CopK family periplasmic copper-binding protein [Hylemonella sp.]|nr:CopK family periplasmic copper-binding protein [Curvibacter delicatus]
MKGGEVLETSDGRKVTATSNEVARLDNLLRQGHDY